jgi:hypothetical protein
MKNAFLLAACLAAPARAHLMIPFQVKGPSGVQYRITSDDNITKTGLIPPSGSIDGTVEGYHSHAGTAFLTGSVDAGLGPVTCGTVTFGVFEPSWHFKLHCLPTFVYDGTARACSSSCAAVADPGPNPAAVPKAFPNPVRATADAMFFVNLPASARVRIYSMTGRLVYEGTSGSDGDMHWHCLDNAGLHVGPGVYVALIEGRDRAPIKLKIAVQH